MPNDFESHPDLPHVHPVILSRWGNLNQGQRDYFIESNAKEVARLEAKSSEDAEKAAQADAAKKVRRVRDDTEKRRAVAAYCLYKWMDFDRRKLPQNEEGIGQHKALVRQYAVEFGTDPETTEYDGKYNGIRLAAEYEEKRLVEQERSRKEAAEAKARQEKELRERQLLHRAARNAAGSRQAAGSTIRLYERRIPGYKSIVTSLDWNIAADTARVALLTPRLETEQYKSDRHQRQLMKVITTVNQRLKGRIARRDYYQKKLDAAEEQVALARKTLGE